MSSAAPQTEVDRVLSAFHPAVRAWVQEQFARPTEVQLRGWDAIANGEHVLLGAPTGSGKTLAAFLWCLSELFSEPLPDDERRLRLVYVSPLRALNHDIERNLRAPLQGVRRHAELLGLAVPELRVGIRTGDTTQTERRRQLRTPPDVLITTPESLYVMLSSRARDIFSDVRWVVVDEIHALASSKRGTHMAFTLERLAVHVAEARAAEGEHPDPVADGPQRIGLSATQRPIERIAAFLGGTGRQVRSIEAARDKRHDIQVRVPVDDMTSVGAPAARTLEDLATPSSNADAGGIWAALHAELLDEVEAHRSTILFTNSRRLAERIATALNDLAGGRAIDRHVAAVRQAVLDRGEEWADDTPVDLPADWSVPVVARAHHGSISREARTDMEELLKAGHLPCIVSTSSLELGIDMGAVDLVLQVESPRSVASGLQRIGRAGHHVGDISTGRIYPKHRADLVESAAVASLMARGEIEPVHVPELCLDVLAQQVVATCAERPFTVDELLRLSQRTYPWRDLSRPQLENLLALLSGAYQGDDLTDLRARVVWDREADTIRTRDDAARLALTNAGTIPDRGLYGVYVVGGGKSRVGELDEEMVHETRIGDVIVLGSTSWRIEEITRDRVHVTPMPGAIGKPPFWHGEGAGRTVELGAAVGELVRVVSEHSTDGVDQVDDERDAGLLALLAERWLCDRGAARNLVRYIREQIAATGEVPSDRTVVVERFRDELGDWRVCILTPLGKPVHGPWAMALEQILADRHGIEATALWSDDGIALRLPDTDHAVPVESLLPDPEEIEDLVVAQLGSSALFAARFREIATRSLVLPLGGYRRRSPLWLQRLKAADVLRAAQGQGGFPLVLETYRECMRDVFALDELRALLTGLRDRSVRLVEVETASASPFSASLLFDYTASLLYEGDQPAAERRAQALSLDQALLRELLGTDELRELLDTEAISQVADELQRRTEERRATGIDQLHDLLRALGDLDEEELAARVSDPARLRADLAELAAQRRVVAVRVGGRDRWIAVEDVGAYVAVLGMQAPRGVPGVFLEPGPDPAERLVGRWVRSHTPFTTASLAQRWGLGHETLEPLLAAQEAGGSLLRGGFLPGGHGEEWCDADVLRRLRRRTLARLRREIEPVEPEAWARFLMFWQGLTSPPPGSVDAARDAILQLEGTVATPAFWEHDLLAPRLASWRGAWLDELVRTGQVTWMGRGTRHGTLQVGLYASEHLALLAPEADEVPDNDDCRTLLEALEGGGARFLRELVAATGIPHERTLRALWTLAAAGRATNDAWGTVRAGASAALAPVTATSPATDTATLRPGRRAGLHTGRRSLLRTARRGTGAGLPGELDQRFQGRWSALSTARVGVDERMSALCEVLLDTFGIVTRQAVQAYPVPGGFASVYRLLGMQEELGSVRRGWFIEGLGGAQFALPEAVDRLRTVREGQGERAPVVTLRANDPAQPYGVALAWPEREGASTPRREPTTYVVLRDGCLLATCAPSGRRVTLYDDSALDAVAAALGRIVERGRVDRLIVESVNGDGLASDQLAAFGAHGFVRTPRGVRATPTTLAEQRRASRPQGRSAAQVAPPSFGRSPYRARP